MRHPHLPFAQTNTPPSSGRMRVYAFKSGIVPAPSSYAVAQTSKAVYWVTRPTCVVEPLLAVAIQTSQTPQSVVRFLNRLPQPVQSASGATSLRKPAAF